MHQINCSCGIDGCDNRVSIDLYNGNNDGTVDLLFMGLNQEGRPFERRVTTTLEALARLVEAANQKKFEQSWNKEV